MSNERLDNMAADLKKAKRIVKKKSKMLEQAAIADHLRRKGKEGISDVIEHQKWKKEQRNKKKKRKLRKKMRTMMRDVGSEIGKKAVANQRKTLLSKISSKIGGAKEEVKRLIKGK